MRNYELRTKNSGLSRGFTLVELILYLAITTIFVTAAILFTWDIVYGRVKSYVHQEVNQNIRFVSQRITYEIRNASGVNSVGGPSLSLSSSDASRDPTVIDLSGGRVRVGWGSTGACPATSPCFLTSNKVNVSSLTFTDLTTTNSTNIRFAITIGSVGDRSEFQITQTNQSSAELRSE